MSLETPTYCKHAGTEQPFWHILPELTISGPEALLGDWRTLRRFVAWTCFWSWLNNSSIRLVSNSNSLFFSAVHMLCLPSTVSLGMASQLKLRILEARIGPLINGPPSEKGPGGGGGGGGGALGGGGGGGGGGIMIWMSIANVMLHRPFKKKNKKYIWKLCLQYANICYSSVEKGRSSVRKLIKKL